MRLKIDWEYYTLEEGLAKGFNEEWLWLVIFQKPADAPDDERGVPMYFESAVDYAVSDSLLDNHEEFKELIKDESKVTDIVLGKLENPNVGKFTERDYDLIEEILIFKLKPPMNEETKVNNTKFTIRSNFDEDEEDNILNWLISP